MKFFHRKTPLQRVVEKIPGGSAVRGGAITAAGLIGLSAVSAAVSAIRDRQGSR
ncbi:hypothetical protein KV102_10015 [Mumia sp. zg.B53]|uniref:hypothetical protein n=1 Tax=Mumia sp. zg.B53 TaxID=2855449 RepID=UPI001C6E35F6|nr:hypothetical protein [Mumia sp. zg.B53]MBW9215174.1 hypothetical protein [Mumia sp. zg.B53]